MFEIIKDYGKKILTSRLFALSVVMVLIFGIMLQRIFVLQIIKGKEYLDNYTLLILFFPHLKYIQTGYNLCQSLLLSSV